MTGEMNSEGGMGGKDDGAGGMAEVPGSGSIPAAFGRPARPDREPEPDTSAMPSAAGMGGATRGTEDEGGEEEEEEEEEEGKEEGKGRRVDVARGVEAILMVADEPQSLVSLATGVGAPVAAVRQAVEGLVEDYDGVAGGVRRGFELREVGGGWRFYVRAEYDDMVAEFVAGENPSKLSQAALETLAVIAYKQPITRGQIASIRAVNVDSVVRTLLGRGLITEEYTDSETGAINYGTTDLLLTQLGVNSIEELPPISPLLEDGAGGFDGDIR